MYSEFISPTMYLIMVGICSIILISCGAVGISIVLFIIRVIKMYYNKAISDFKTKYKMEKYDNGGKDYDW